MEPAVSSSRQKAASAALFLFAFVGFIASVVAIVTYLQPSGGGVLRIQVQPNEFRMPLEVAAPFTDENQSRDLLRSLRNSFCNSATPTTTEIQKRPSPPTTGRGDKELCAQASDAEELARWSSSYAENPGTLYRYEIENRGSSAARNIRVAAEGVASFQLQRGSDFTNIQPDEGGDFYSLPDLNPREKATVLIWMTSRFLSLDEYTDAPQVTFAGASVSTEIQRRVPEAWWGVYDLFGEAPLIISIPLVIALAFVISLAVVLIIAAVDALVRGKPLKSIFATAQPPASASDDTAEG